MSLNEVDIYHINEMDYLKILAGLEKEIENTYALWIQFDDGIDLIIKMVMDDDQVILSAQSFDPNLIKINLII
jgi:hypothetical protein